MSSISKSLLIASAILVLTAFMPSTSLQAAIFDGTETELGEVYGLCLTDPGAMECEGIKCDDPQNNSEIILCTSEAEAGTVIAKGELAGSGITHTDDLGDFIIKLVNFALPYLTLAAFIGYVIAGFMYVTALGNDEQLQKAKKILIWSSVGLILVILSFAITSLLTKQLVEGLAG